MCKVIMGGTLSLIALAVATNAHAQSVAPTDAEVQAVQQDDGPVIGEIVVTAQKRSESLQKVPLAITAVTSAELDRSGINDLQGVVATVPNLNLGQQLGMAKIALRGIGLENISAGAEGSIAFHLNGVFLSRSIAALASFYDVEQVEVLRGPQGTLYGRNATGGSININTREPTWNSSGYFRLTAGNYGRVTTEGAVSGEIVPDVLAARIAFQTQDRDGFGENTVTGTEIDDLRTRAIRGTLLFTPTDRLSVNVKADYFHEKDRAGGYHALGAAGFEQIGGPDGPITPIVPVGIQWGGSYPTNLRDISNEEDPRNNVEFWGVSGKISYELSSDIELSSLTAYRWTNNSAQTDLDATGIAVAKQFQYELSKQFSQEFQLSGQANRLTWLLGVYYFHENDAGYQFTPFNNASPAVGFPMPGTFVQGYLAKGYIKTDAVAVFGQGSYEVTDDLTLTLGARYSSEKKTDHDELSFDVLTPYTGPQGFPDPLGVADRSKRWKSFTPRVAIDYQVTPDALLYASWSKGFKSGTYNLGALQDPVVPERISAFEAGVKSQLFNRRLRLNLAGFYYDYKDLQIGKVVGAQLALENAATAEIYGLEAELRATVTENFEINANGAWLHARFDEYTSEDPSSAYLGEIDLSGNALSQAPDFTAAAGAQYRIPSNLGDFTLRGEVAWRDRTYFTPFNVDYVSQPANTKFNAFLNWESNDGDWNGQLFMKNITNKTVIANSLISWVGVGFGVNGYLEEPRTYGVTVGHRF
ncbi:TonB-dependent receptor [Croceicoccus mobilis]|uniref:TonB-dependent receptor n=1 Tax=Croceicoccus mobilis TaxID=1703339 RepID=A0A917DW75_9SPHN|nr:TonB-dependent receptor [Croceicoccus mobilis]GGD77307.1 TonB-dependent receptor [Croceicoccus mobilis]